MFKRRNIIINFLLICVLAIVGFFGYRALYPAVAPEVLRTSPVTIGDVVTTVSASGSVQSTSDIGLTFKTNGIVLKVNVKVGDKVGAGKLLAYIDDSTAKLALLQAQSSVKSAELSALQAQQSQESADLSVLTSQDALDTLLAGPTTATKDSQAQALYNARLAVTVAEENVAKAGSDIAQQVTTTATNLAGYDRTIERARYDLVVKCGSTDASCESLTSAAATAAAKAQATAAATAAAKAAAATAVAAAATAAANAAATEAATAAANAAATAAANAAAATAAADAAAATAAADAAATTAANAAATTPANARSAYLSWQDAQLAKTAGILKDTLTTATLKTVLDTAKRNLDTAKYNLVLLGSTQAEANKPATAASIASAKQSVANAKRSQQSAAISLKQSEITIANAQATLINAQANLDGTKIIAPVSGTIAAIATPAGVNAGSTTAGSGGVAGYIILTDLNSLQVKASVAEADVVTLQVGQSANFTFDALSSVQVGGTVISVAPVNNAATGAGSVMSYTVLFSLDSNPEGVKPGMTSQVSVVTAQSLGVLNIPSSAVTQIGRMFTVTLKPKADGEVGERVNVEVGLQGDSRIEILNGLKEGDEVVLRAVTSSGSNGFPTGGVPGAGNGGGGGRGGN